MTVLYVVSGGFDPLHEGHMENIIESRESSDGVIVLLNSDDWLIRKKGKSFLNFETRKIIMENIKGVIAVFDFDDTDNSACEGLKKVRHEYPDAKIVFAKGGDRTADNIPEISICKDLNIQIKYNVGTSISGRIKPNSSSWILEKWSKR